MLVHGVSDVELSDLARRLRADGAGGGAHSAGDADLF